jgi:hypothetical protein
MARETTDRLLMAAAHVPSPWRLAVGRVSARRGMGVPALRAARDDWQVQVDLGLYDSASTHKDPVGRLIGLAGLGRLDEARALLARTPDLDDMNRFRLARAVAPVSPDWALELLDAGTVEQRAACLLALDRPAEAEAILQHQPSGREGRLLRAAAFSAQGRFRQARRALNGLFEADLLEPPLAVEDEPLSIEAFGVPALAPVEGPRISVIVAVKNGEATIGMALKSLQAQSLSPREILVVDDASSDETARIVSQLAAADPRVRLVRNTRAAGAYGARNTGLQLATGDVMAFHDADDWAHPRRLEKQVQGMEGGPASVGAYFRLTPGGRIMNPRIFPLLRPNPILLMMRREAAARVGLFEEVRLGGDSEYQARLDARLGRWNAPRLKPCLVVAQWSHQSLMSAPGTGLTATGTALRVAYAEAWRRRHAFGAA